DSVDQVKRFDSAGWAATRVDGHDPQAVANAIAQAKAADRPSLIACRTTIGYGAPTKANSEKAHGSPLGAEEIAGARQRLGWTSRAFEIPADIRDAWHAAGQRSRDAKHAWIGRVEALDAATRAEFERRMRGELPKAQFAAAVTAVKE